MATMLNPNAIPDGSITKEKIDPSVLTSISESVHYADVVDGLDSTETDKPLSANQGRVLDSRKQDKTSLVSDLATQVNALSSSDKAAFLGQIGAASEGTFASHNNDNTRHITAAERTKWNAKQDALTLTVKDNGNIVIANIQGQSKEFMPATPSGDPMHYAYEAAGAVWNGTGQDITRVGRMTGDTIIHKAGYWYLNELGDISNEEMRAILIQGRNSDCLRCSTSSISDGLRLRTNLYPLWQSEKLNWTYIEVLVLLGNPEVMDYTMDYNPNVSYTSMYFRSNYCRKILTIISSKKMTILKDYSPTRLEFFKLKNMALSQYIISPYFREDCILYMIQNEAATSAITITLHADAYARAMANADIVAALQAHPNVSLASA